jgi:hypothetical protein
LKIASEFQRPPKETINSRRFFLAEDLKEIYRFLGICIAIDALLYFRLIDNEITESMHYTMELYAMRNNLDTEEHYWPLTPEGDKERVKFCLKQAAKL